MNRRRMVVSSVAGTLVVAVLLLVATGTWAQGEERALPLAQADAVPSTISYQGRLLNTDGSPVEGTHTMSFRIYAQESGGVALWSDDLPVQVEGGLFHVQLDVDAAVFDGEALWLGVEVEGDGEELSPRQPLLPVPYALHALTAPWAGLTGVPAGLDDGDDDTTYTSGTGLSLVDTEFNISVSYRLPQGCGGGEIAEWNGTSWQCGGDDDTTYTAGMGLGLVGTEFLVGASYRLPQSCGGGEIAEWDGSAWQCGGDDDTTYTAGMGLGLVGTEFMVGASYRLPQGCGGGEIARWDGTSWQCGIDAIGPTGWLLTGNNGTDPTVNYLGTADRVSLTLAVSGTPALRLEPTGFTPNVIGGYGGNSVAPGVVGAVIGGGGESAYPNYVAGEHATIGGGFGNTASVSAATVGGGEVNTASAAHATIGGGYSNIASAGAATVGGGGSNSAETVGATVGGGSSNTAGGFFATVGGGSDNTASGDEATVGGGSFNTASGEYATVGGGDGNTASNEGATIGGGGGNATSGIYAAVGGGEDNVSSSYATVGGGDGNAANGPYTTVGGGQDNSAGENYATVGGGYDNSASGLYATVGGGSGNTAYGAVATVPGGDRNTASGDYSFAAGRRAKANNSGCFVWGDSTDANVSCNNNNRTIFRSTGGFYIYTSNAATPSGLYLAAGGSSWNTHSDRTVKENFQSVDRGQLLARLAEIPISTWNYTSQDPAIRHIGPMAQDFNALLPDLGGEGETYINTLDADGVALAAIQGLYAHNQELESENAALRAEVDGLEERLAAVEAAVGMPRTCRPRISVGWWLSGMLVIVLLSGLAAFPFVVRRRAPGCRQ